VDKTTVIYVMFLCDVVISAAYVSGMQAGICRLPVCLTSLAMPYSSWSIVHSYLFYSLNTLKSSQINDSSNHAITW